MSLDAYIGEIHIFGFNYAPRGWAQCDGQFLSISDNTALFSLLGTTYGGDGVTTFGLPDLRGRVPMHPGQEQGLSPRKLGDQVGESTVTLTTNELPSHNHQLELKYPIATTATTARPQQAYLAEVATEMQFSTDKLVDVSSVQLDLNIQTDVAGNDQPHNNMQPYLVLNYCIAIDGIFPPRP